MVIGVRGIGVVIGVSGIGVGVVGYGGSVGVKCFYMMQSLSLLYNYIN